MFMSPGLILFSLTFTSYATTRFRLHYGEFKSIDGVARQDFLFAPPISL
jgi:hypothetical protein